MQFNLSTLLLVAPAVAFGCTGWKLANWMIEQDPGIEIYIYSLLAGSLLLLIALAVVAGRRAAAWGVTGFVLSILLLLLLFGPPSPPSLWWIVPLFGAPLGLFVGSVRFACETSRSLAVRQGFLLPSCLMAGWMLAVLTHG